jgi:hypothetical protein
MNQKAPKKTILLTSDRPHTVYGDPESRRCTAVKFRTAASSESRFLASKGADEVKIEPSFGAAIRTAKEQKSISLQKTRGSNLCGVPSPKSERVTWSWIPTTPLLTACSALPFAEPFPAPGPWSSVCSPTFCELFGIEFGALFGINGVDHKRC